MLLIKQSWVENNKGESLLPKEINIYKKRNIQIDALKSAHYVVMMETLISRWNFENKTFADKEYEHIDRLSVQIKDSCVAYTFIHLYCF